MSRITENNEEQGASNGTSGNDIAEKPAQPPLATLIIDRSVFALCSETGLCAPDGKPYHYFDTLTELGKAGVEIIIPEIAALESNRILKFKNGTSLNDYFQSGEHATPFDKFIHEVARDRVPHVHMPATLQPPESRAFIARYEHAISGEGKNWPQKIRSRIMDVDEAYQSNKAELHHKAITALVDALPPGQPNVFVMTGDTSLLKTLRARHPHIEVIKPAGFTHSLADSGLSNHLPFFDTDITAHDLNLHRIDQTSHERKRGRGEGGVIPPHQLPEKEGTYPYFHDPASRLTGVFEKVVTRLQEIEKEDKPGTSPVADRNEERMKKFANRTSGWAKQMHDRVGRRPG